MENLPHDPACRLLERYSTLEYILLGDLRDLLEDGDDEQVQQKWLLAVLDALVDTLPREFALEEHGGYMAAVLEEYPSWFPAVDRLHREHTTLFVKLRTLRNRIAQQEPFTGIADQVRCELRDWMQRLIAHNRHETRLLQTAINLEVGTGD